RLIDRAGLAFEKIRDRDLSLTDRQPAQRKSCRFARWCWLRRRWRRSRRAFCERREIPHTLAVTNEFDAGLVEIDRVDLYVTGQQRQQADSNVQLIGVRKRELAFEGGVFGNDDVLY